MCLLQGQNREGLPVLLPFHLNSPTGRLHDYEFRQYEVLNANQMHSDGQATLGADDLVLRILELRGTFAISFRPRTF